MTANLENIHEIYNIFCQKNRMNADIINLFDHFHLSKRLRHLKMEKQQGVSASLLIVLLCLFRMGGTRGRSASWLGSKEIQSPFRAISGAKPSHYSWKSGSIYRIHLYTFSDVKMSFCLRVRVTQNHRGRYQWFAINEPTNVSVPMNRLGPNGCGHQGGYCRGWRIDHGRCAWASVSGNFPLHWLIFWRISCISQGFMRNLHKSGA